MCNYGTIKNTNPGRTKLADRCRLKMQLFSLGYRATESSIYQILPVQSSDWKRKYVRIWRGIPIAIVLYIKQPSLTQINRKAQLQLVTNTYHVLHALFFILCVCLNIHLFNHDYYCTRIQPQAKEKTVKASEYAHFNYLSPSQLSLAQKIVIALF